MNSPDHSCDIVVLGGGLAGSCLARQILEKHPERSVMILEKRQYPVSEATHKVGESTVEVGAHYLADEVGLKKHLVESQLPKFGLRFFFDQDHGSLEEAIEVGLSDFFPTPGYQIDRGRLENYLSKSIAEMGGNFRQGARIKNVSLNSEDGDHLVEFEQDETLHSVKARWVVDASGRVGILKRKLNLAKPVNHRINAVWFRLGKKICVDQWCDSQEWLGRTGKVERRWLSTNHLLGRGYWIWIIPLASGATSIGIVADPRFHPLSELSRFEKALDWMERHEPLCARAIIPFADEMMDFKAVKNIAYSCEQVYSADRWALTGEAGVFLDPLYSPGIDYIAIANTQILDLVERDFNGEPIDLLAPRYQGIFLAFFQDNLQTYVDQYEVFGNPRVMSLKYIWDYAIYWGFPALFYFNGKFTDPTFFSKVGEQVELIRELNRKMQGFLREWNAVDSTNSIDPVFVNQNEIHILRQLNGELRTPLDDTALEERLKRNATILEDLAMEITRRASEMQPGLLPDLPTARGGVSRLEGVFETLGI